MHEILKLMYDRVFAESIMRMLANVGLPANVDSIVDLTSLRRLQQALWNTVCS
jgi:hypothetical protein